MEGSPNRPDFVDDRRPRHLIIVDHSTLLGDGRGYGRGPTRQTASDDPSRGPAYRDGRLPKEPDYFDRHGRMRAPPDAFHGRPGSTTRWPKVRSPDTP
jgi:THO complex subunit 2